MEQPKPWPRRMTYAEYLELDNASEERHEFYDGWVVPLTCSDPQGMTGGTFQHNAIVANLTLLVGNALKGSGCRMFTSHQRVRHERHDFAAYPDVTVVCGDWKATEGDPDGLTNPVLVVEVLSRSTEKRDRGDKLRAYRRFDSLEHVLLVSQTVALVEHYVRAGDLWARADQPDDRVVIAHPPLDLRYADIYEHTDVDLSHPITGASGSDEHPPVAD